MKLSFAIRHFVTMNKWWEFFANWILPCIFSDMEKWRGSVWHFRVVRPDLKIWNAPWIRICILRRFRWWFPIPRDSSLHGPRLSSFRRLRCKLQYSRAIRSNMKIYASADQTIRYASSIPRDRTKNLRTSVFRAYTPACSQLPLLSSV